LHDTLKHIDVAEKKAVQDPQLKVARKPRGHVQRLELSS
jgi:hypothetical protein